MRSLKWRMKLLIIRQSILLPNPKSKGGCSFQSSAYQDINSGHLSHRLRPTTHSAASSLWSNHFNEPSTGDVQPGRLSTGALTAGVSSSAVQHSCVCANYKTWHLEWGNSADWTLWYTEGVHVRGLEETTQVQCHTPVGRGVTNTFFPLIRATFMPEAHKEGWRQIIQGRQSAKSQDCKYDCVEYPGNGENSEEIEVEHPGPGEDSRKKGHVKPHAPVNQMRRQLWHTLESVRVSTCVYERVWSRVSLYASHHKSTLWWFLMACQAKTQALLVEATAVCVSGVALIPFIAELMEHEKCKLYPIPPINNIQTHSSRDPLTGSA